MILTLWNCKALQTNELWKLRSSIYPHELHSRAGTSQKIGPKQLREKIAELKLFHSRGLHNYRMNADDERGQEKGWGLMNRDWQKNSYIVHLSKRPSQQESERLAI